ncbi:MarR family transcriptional regulator [Lentzea sp. NBRC 105346]|uniref:MarR family winged helix-turn-helix transcriptional regulator n=1 Tax=Lentzea sp. NBRC 105346 TaxID=3032205 RepID=UPI0024A3C4F5|nr:MarR family winged helix-turn-helix transcriptional regulator [Lentzea sp. NBRC 105346]GLZ32573.1 MarR family transcriptional regulator [Lentzea sp. NBRC 105346]
MEPVSMLLAMAYRAMGDQFHERLRAVELEPLRPAHGYVFRFLAERRATAQDLAAHLGVTKQAAAKIVSELVEWRYVQREPHPTDKRAQYVTLTTKGRDYLKFADGMWADLEAEMASVIGTAELHALKGNLKKYLDHVGVHHLRPVW